MSSRILSEASGEVLADHIKQNGSNVETVAQAVLTIQNWLTGAENRISALEAAGGTGTNVEDLFNIALSDTYHINDDVDASAVIANELNLRGFASQIGTSGITWKAPTVYVPSITWSSDVDENYDLIASVPVSVNFGSLGTISKTITFKKPGEGKLYAAKLSSTNAYIDTGVAADYGHTLHAKGFGETSTTTLLGAFVSNSERATFRILPSSGAAQHMWPINQQYSSAQLGGITVTSVFEYWQKANYLRVVQGNIDTVITPSGNTGTGSVGANYFLLSEDAATSRGYGTVVFAEILDSNNTQVAYFAPYKLHSGEVVFLNTSGLTAQQIYDVVETGDSSVNASRIIRPANGTLVEVSPV